jgi:hypothetical protein
MKINLALSGLGSVSITMALVGQALWHSLQAMHLNLIAPQFATSPLQLDTAA